MVIHRARLLIILALAAIECGCVYSSETLYPTTWPSLSVGAKDCSALAGVFDESPVARADEKAGMTVQIGNLSSLLDRSTIRFNPFLHVQRVELRLEGETFQAVAHGLPGEEPLVLQVTDRWHCVDGRLYAEFSDSEVSEHDAVRKNRESVLMFATDNGELVVEVRGHSTGLSILPYSVGGSYWNRYRRTRT